jgi:hypothetical protein
MIPDFLFCVTKGDIIYDIETYPNCFTIGLKHVVTGRTWYFEISDRRNDANLFIHFLNVLREQECRMVGFNNIGFDYPVIHAIYMSGGYVKVDEIYNKAMSIINAPHHARFSHVVYESDWIVPQIDLFKIHHFDNMARSTSLKVLEFNMIMDSIEDLPFDVGTYLTNTQMDILGAYMWHDIKATLDFYHETKDQIAFREQLTLQYDKNFLNHNDTKIGKDYFIMKLEEAERGCCYRKVDGRRKIMQTPRESIALGDVILPYIQFTDPEFQRILTWFQKRVITETKGSIKDVNCTIDNFRYDFGTGGIHGSVDSQVVTSDDNYIIEDWDVASYYPNLAIVNRLHPEHLGDNFCDIYQEMYQQRKGYAKGTAENAMLKLALNGTYGDSNNEYSPFYDPKFTMAITINGQLSLCMLAEALLQHDDMQMIQINTDGLTIKYPRVMKDWVHSVCTWWEKLTKLELEVAEYSRFMVRDVNNYIAEYTDGSLKRKGAYEYKLAWHQNHSQIVVAKAAEAALVHGTDIREFIMNHDNEMDFMLRTKVPRSMALEWGFTKVQNIVRYYVSLDGDILEKVMPPKGPDGAYKRANKLTDEYFDQIKEEVGDAWDERIHTKNKSKYEIRRTSYHNGYTVMLCNNMAEHSVTDINYEYYINETKKLVEPLL